MIFRAFATDYDGTLAQQGVVAPETVEALLRLRESGVRLILVTGREIPDLQRVFPHTRLFERIVAENGALLYRPGDASREALAPPPPEIFLRRLRERAVQFSAGEVVVATTRPWRRQMEEVIEETGLPLAVILNKEAVMVLPRGVEKGTGLDAALREIGIDWTEAVGVGDAENDVDFLSRCGFAVATGNALHVVRDVAHFITPSENGAGVREAIERLLTHHRHE